MKIYLAAAWSRRREMQKVARELEQLGVEVTSRWLHEQQTSKSVRKHRRETALIDIADVKAADCLVRFSDDLSSSTIPSYLASGARMFETGLAFASGKPIYVVGGEQNVFDFLPNIIHLKNLAHLKRELCLEEVH